MNCNQVRARLEAHGDDFRVREHLSACADCGEYAALQQWSARVVQAGAVEAVPPLMSELWASIHRATGQAWDSALTRSFRRLLPYKVALTALLVLVGVLQPFAGVNKAATTATATSTNVLVSMEDPPVAAVLKTSMTPRTASDVLGVGH